MGERQNTVVCSFEPNSPKLPAFDIHEWIFTELKIPERDIITIQIDTINRHVNIKMVNADTVHALLDRTGGQVECKHTNGEISRVHMAMAGLGRKKGRIANLAPEVANEAVRAALTPYGKIQDIYNEK
jgi:arginyl-tRNA synthetase